MCENFQLTCSAEANNVDDKKLLFYLLPLSIFEIYRGMRMNRNYPFRFIVNEKKNAYGNIPLVYRTRLIYYVFNASNIQIVHTALQFTYKNIENTRLINIV